MNKLKLKFLTTLTLIGVIFAACEMNEDVISENHYSNDLKIKLYEKKYEQLMTEKKFINSFSKIPKKSSNLILNRTVMEDEYGFTISDKPAKVIEMNGDISYTFLIERDSIDTNFFENLVVQTDSLDNTEAYIIKYTLTSDYFNTDHNSLDYTTTKEITPIIYNNQSSTSSTSNKVIYQETCTVLNYITCCQSWGGGAGSCHPAQEICLTSSAGTQYLSSTSETVCTTTEIDLGDTSGGGGSSSGGGGSGGGGSVNTSPVNNCRDCIPAYAPTPCDKINNLKSIANIQTELSNMGSKTSDLTEWGRYKLTSASVVQTPPSTSAGEVSFPMPASGQYVFMAHTHNSPASSTYSVFSFADLLALADLLKKNKIDTNNFVAFLATADGTYYALTIENTQNFLKFFAVKGDPLFDMNIATKRVELASKYYGELVPNPSPIIDYNTTPLNDEIAFLNLLQNNNLGLSLLESNSTFTSFEKVTFNQTTGNIDKQPCP